MRFEKSLLLFCLFLLGNCALLKPSTASYEPEMVFVEGGSFLLGDFYEQENTDALPVHEVTVNSFSIGKFETTFEQYDEFARKTNRELPDDGGNGRGKRAVVYITWDDAKAFCKSLGYRLPSEIEWEYAARSRGKNYLFSGTNNPDSLGFYGAIDNSDINFTFPVGSFLPNELGLYDMSGNAFEWIDEFYQFYQDPSSFHDHVNDGIRIIRGGSFTEQRTTTRTYWRTGTLRDVKASDLGFRCVSSK